MSDLGTSENIVQFISGVDAAGRVAPISFQTWTGSGDPSQTSSYSSYADLRKWGGNVPGTGATVSYGFDPASQWSATERNAFVAAMHLWQAEANVTFVPAASAGSANLLFTRAHDGKAQSFLDGTSVAAGSAVVGTATRSGVSIDTSVAGFGPIGGNFATYGGYPWTTALHEIGHALGLGHAGPYDGSETEPHQNGTLDNTSMSIMSYFGPSYSGYDYNWGDHAGYEGSPVTPMQLDIYAIQRLYGLPVNSPLSGGNVFGFNSNIQGDIRPFFDFTLNPQPIVTLWSGGGGNSLDLTGYATASSGSIRAGASYGISAGGLTHNIMIAEGTRIDTILLGAGNDTIGGNDDSDVIIGGGGGDVLSGGSGNDHIYGGGRTQTAGDGADSLSGGDGSDYLQGNAGRDTLLGGAGSDRLFGGADDDVISGEAGNDTINGNLGADSIDGGSQNDLIRGGQGDDTINGNFGDDVVRGDLGNDVVEGGWGFDILYGGEGADVFVFVDRDGEYATQYANAYRLDEVVDFADGTDHFRFGASPSAFIQLGAEPSAQAAAEAATPYLNGPANIAANFSQVVVASVGSDTLVFFWAPAVGMSGVQIDNFRPDQLTGADFV